jgi:hypothetical protein
MRRFMRGRGSGPATGLIVSMLTMIMAIAAEEKRIDLSTIVPKTDAEAILGEPVKDPRPINMDGKDGYYSKCNYYSASSARTLLLRVRQAAEGSVPAHKEFEQISATGGAMKAITGLGEKAGMFNGSPQNGLPANVILLYVVKGKSFITVGVGGLTNEAVALEKAKSVAEKILKQL